MNDEFFVDTNILVYAFDVSEKQKRQIAKNIVEDITKGRKKGVISNQILGELFIVLTNKITNPLNEENAQIIVNGIIDSVNWKKVNYTTSTIHQAMDTVIKEKRPFWDTIITETMLENKIYVILTENTKDFKSKNITAHNPFKND